MWSIAGVVSRHLEAARGFEVTFWRSAFNALALVVMLGWMRGPARCGSIAAQGDRALWVSGVCWAVMFTAFMLALTLTTVANVLVTMALAPLFTALARALSVLGHRLPTRTWAAIAWPASALPGCTARGGRRRGAAPAGHGWWRWACRSPPPPTGRCCSTCTHGAMTAGAGDMLPAVLVGALLSAAGHAAAGLPLRPSPHDLGLLPCWAWCSWPSPACWRVVRSRVLKAPEISLLALLEVVFGVLWAWLGAGERPACAVLGGGALVLPAENDPRTRRDAGAPRLCQVP
jgi:hypothetical protein